jgi:hypothetical protein
MDWMDVESRDTETVEDPWRIDEQETHVEPSVTDRDGESRQKPSLRAKMFNEAVRLSNQSRLNPLRKAESLGLNVLLLLDHKAHKRSVEKQKTKKPKTRNGSKPNALKKCKSEVNVYKRRSVEFDPPELQEGGGFDHLPELRRTFSDSRIEPRPRGQKRILESGNEETQ